jgi:large repetitive protein
MKFSLKTHLRRSEDGAVSSDRKSEAGDTLIEVLIAIVVMGITSVAVLLAFATSISGSAEHRSLATMDTVLRTAAEEAISQIQQQSNAQFGQCPVPNKVTFNLPQTPAPGWSATLAPTINGTTYSTKYWNGTTYDANACVPSTATHPQVNSPQLVTVAVTSPTGVVSSPLSFVVNDVQTRPVPQQGTASQLAFLTSPTGGTAGSAFATQPAVAVEDSNGNIVTNDFSTVTLSIASGTTGANLNNCTGTEFNGVITFTGCSIDTTGTYTLLATYSIAGPSGTIVTFSSPASAAFAVTPAPASQLVFSPATAGPGVAGSVIPNLAVQVQDFLGNVVTNVNGSVALTIKSGSPQAGFTSGTSTVAVTGGVANFSNLVLNTAGSYTLSAAPVSIAGVTGTTAPLTIAPASASTFTVTNPGNQNVGTAFGLSLAAYDPYGNLATGFNGTQALAFSGPSNSPNATTPTYPSSASFSSGFATVSGITLFDAQTTSITVKQGSVTGTSGNFVVAPLAASKFLVPTPATQTAGIAFNEVLTATDLYGNVLTTYSGNKAIAFTGPANSPNGATAPTYPSSVSFTAGVGTASITLVNAQSTSLTATQSGVTGSSGSFTVVPAPTNNKLVFSPVTPGPGTSGTAIPNLAVQLQDTYGNLMTAATGSVTMSIKAGSAQSTFTSGTPSVGLIGGTATFTNLVVATSGTYTLTATPVSISGVTTAVNSGSFTVNVLPNITTLTLPGATKTGTYSQTLAVSGGTAPYNWSLSAGSLPAGLTLNPSTGVIGGTVSSTAVSQSFTALVTDVNGGTDTQALTITVNAIPNISTTSLPGGTKTGAYSQTLAVTGGTTPYTWSLSSGTLPTGLTLNASTGVISGTVSNAAASQTFTVAVTDANNVVDTQGLTITVNAIPNISTTTLPAATKTGTYSQTLAVTSGTAAYTWSVSVGTLPAGLSLNASTGVISGTASSNAATQTFTVQVTDANGVTDTQQLTITVNAAPSITTTTLGAATRTGAYSAGVAATGGTTAYTWSIQTGTLPTGLTLNAATGVISGTVTGTTSQTFTVKVTDANNVTATKSLTITVNGAIAIQTTTLAGATHNVAYSKTITVTGGTTPDSWTVISGSLPTGLTLSGTGNGTISGTPTTTGTKNFTVQVTDANGVTDTQALSITVS